MSPGKEPGLGLFDAPPLPQNFQEPGGEHDVAVFLPFAEVDADAHTPTISFGGFRRMASEMRRPAA